MNLTSVFSGFPCRRQLAASALLLCSALASVPTFAAAPAVTVSAHAGDDGKPGNHILVGGDVGFGFTTHSAECYTNKKGKFLGFQSPYKFSNEPHHPEVTGILKNGAWYFDLHSPHDRYFHSDNARGVVPRQQPHGWKIKLHKVLLPERLTMHAAKATVSAVITCSKMTRLPGS